MHVWTLLEQRLYRCALVRDLVNRGLVSEQLHGGCMVNYRPWHVCVKGDEELFEWIKLHVSSLFIFKSLSPLLPVSFSRSCSMPSGTPGTVSSHISLGCLTVAERWLLSSWGASVDRDGFTVVLVARHGPVDPQSFLRPPAWPPLILVIYIHRHLRRKPLRLVHADSHRDLHWVINSSHVALWSPGVNFKGLAELEGVDVSDGRIRAVGMWSPAIN